MITATPDQARAFRAWVIAVLNLDDQGAADVPAPFGEANVRWSPTDYPRAGNLYAMLREVAYVEHGEPIRQRETIDDGLPTEELRQYAHTIADWTVSVQIVSKLDEANPELERAASRYLKRLTMRVMGEETAAMRAVGCAWRRSGQILPLDRIARGSQWETRAALDLTFCVGEFIVERPGWIESMAGAGTLAPLPPEPFTADDDDDLDNLL